MKTRITFRLPSGNAFVDFECLIILIGLGMCAGGIYIGWNSGNRHGSAQIIAAILTGLVGLAAVPASCMMIAIFTNIVSAFEKWRQRDRK